MKIRVFLADDHSIVRDGLRMLLESQSDLTVIGEASNGREAVRLVTNLKPDVLVIDITMPELNGIEATRQVRSACPNTQVVILSMHSSQDLVYSAFQAGAMGYLIKETAGRELYEAVRAVHGGRRYLSQRITDVVFDRFVELHKRPITTTPLEQLSPREREILQMIVEGKSTTEIAGILFLATSTVDTYRSRLMTKLGISNLPSLVKFAIQNKIISLE